MIVRPAEPADHDAIRQVLLAAFPDATEADLVEQLRSGGHAEIELVAGLDGAVVGHILFSPMEAPFRALALAPVAVIPPRQRNGIGSALIEHGHDLARQGGWQAIFLVGEPDYYSRFGYSTEAAKPFGCAFAGPYFMMRAIAQPLPAASGEVRYAPPFAELA